jgi:hypothetical protein
MVTFNLLGCNPELLGHLVAFVKVHRVLQPRSRLEAVTP